MIDPLLDDSETTSLYALDGAPARQPMRTAARAETPLHATADAHVSKIEVALRYAFAAARRTLAPGKHKIELALTVLREELEATLPKVLHKTVVAGGVTGGEMLWQQMRTAGDYEGHPFHGNQWTGGEHIKETTITQPSGYRFNIRVTRKGPQRYVAERREVGTKEWKHSADVEVISANRTRGLANLTGPEADAVARLIAELDPERLRGYEGFRTLKRTDRPQIDFAYNRQSDAAVTWADKHAAELIDGITETSREAINNSVAEFLETGDWNEHVDEILEAVGDTARANLIARNESMIAVHEGQREAWDQAIEEGLLTGEEMREWIVVGDEKVCPICQGLDGKRAKLGQSYISDEGEAYEGPPAHVSCRCSEGIV